MIALRKAVDTNNGAWPKLTGNNPAYKDAHSDLWQSALREISTSIKEARQHGFPAKRKIFFKHKRKKDRSELTSVPARYVNAKSITSYFASILGHHNDGHPRMFNEREK